MNDEQSTRFAVAFARQAARLPTSGLCGACVDVLAVAGVGITLMGGHRAGPVCVSDGSIAELEDLQFMLGQGPSQDAFQLGASVLTPQFGAAAVARWPSFVELARARGFDAVFAYPLLSRSTGSAGGRPADGRIGTLALYQHAGGDLTVAQQADSTVMAVVIAETVLSLQAAESPGTLAPGLDDAVAYRAEIHQAAGMVAVQLRIPVDAALVRLRAHAYVTDRSVREIATDIVLRRLRLDDDHDLRDPRERA